MADSLYLSLWFPSFDLPDILSRTISVLRQIPFSAAQPGVSYLAIHPVSWNEPTVLERRFVPPLAPEDAVTLTTEFLHEDYAYVYETYWDLWGPAEAGASWVMKPSLIRVIAHGAEFEDDAAATAGQIQIDFGFDTPFLHEEMALTMETETRVRSNVQRLVEFTGKMESNSGATGRLLWSESDENLAQKLISRLQRTN
ncbi:MAG: hypothetical protein WBS24_17665 [Terriglobales bacterium]